MNDILINDEFWVSLKTDPAQIGEVILLSLESGDSLMVRWDSKGYTSWHSADELDKAKCPK